MNENEAKIINYIRSGKTQSAEDIMPIVFITDDNYAMPTAVAVTSLYCNKKSDSKYKIYIICTDVAEENIVLLKQLNKDDFIVDLIFLDSEKYKDLTINNLHVSTASIYKFELPKIFSQYDKILYLDSDMLILKDLSKLFDIDISSYYAAVVKDYKVTTYNPPMLNKLNLEGKHEFYWNSGMMLLNLKTLRDDNIPDKLIEYRKNGINYFMDQDAFNVVFNENVLYTSFEYNTFITTVMLYSPSIVQSYYDIDPYDSIREVIERSSILHLTGPCKPWEHLMPIASEMFCYYHKQSPYSFQTLSLLNNDPVENMVDKSIDDKNIYIVYICDNSSAKNVSVSVTSLYCNRNPENIYNIYIYCDKLTTDYQLRLEELSKNDFNVSIIDICEYDYKNFYSQTRVALSPITLTQIMLPELLNKIDKVIFITNDTLVLKDLKPLFDIDISEKYAAVVRDFKAEKYYKPAQYEKLDLPQKKYFNNGVMLLNLKEMRGNKVSEKCLYYKKYGINFLASDACNVCYEGKVKYISYYFNALDNIKEINDKEDIYKYIEIKNYYNFAELYSRCFILFFNRNEKPWNVLTPVTSDIYLRYFIRSTFSDLPYQNEMDEYIEQIRKDDSNDICGEINEDDKFYSEAVQKNLYPHTLIQLYTGKYSEIVNEQLKYYANVSSDGLNHEPRKKKIIVSLTTIPFRIKAAAQVISIMMHQTLKPDKIVLYLGKDSYEYIKFPDLLEKEIKCGVEIKFCEDLISHTKYFYALQDYPDDILITVDDDILYEDTLIETLYDSYLKFPNAVSAMRAHLITFTNKNEFAAYRKWKGSNYDYICIPSHKLLATGVGGVLYPPHSLHSEVFNLENIRKLASRQDDLWLKFMELLNDTPVVVAKRRSPLEFIEHTQEVGLCYENVDNGQNDISFSKLIEEYNEFLPDSTLKERFLSEDDAVPVFNINAPQYDNAVSGKIINEIKELRIKNKSLEKTVRCQNEKINKYEMLDTVSSDLKLDRLDYIESELNRLKNQIEYNEDFRMQLILTRASFTYKIGRVITWLPRKLREIFSDNKV